MNSIYQTKDSRRFRWSLLCMVVWLSLVVAATYGCGGGGGGGGGSVAGGGDGGGEAGGETPAGGTTQTGGKKSISGVIQKGPFAKGTTITIQPLDSKMNATGSPYTTETTDDLGSFELSAAISAPYVEITATGNYFDEVSGQMTTAPLTLKSISSLSSGKTTVNVNVMTNLQCEKLAKMVQEGTSFEKAKTETEAMIVKTLNLKKSVSNFDKLDMSKKGEANAALLAASSILQQMAITDSVSNETNAVKELKGILSSLTEDISDDGDLDDASLAEKMVKSSKELNPKKVKYFLQGKYSESEEEVSIPDIEEFVASEDSCEAKAAEAVEPVSAPSADTAATILATLTPAEVAALNSILHKDFPYAILKSVDFKYTQWVQIATLPNYGVLLPLDNSDFSLFSSGNALKPSEWGDLDLYPWGSKGDLSGVILEILVPPSATSLSFDFELLSYEYPEYVGSVFNDYFAANLTMSDGTKQISFDPFGNPININNVFFDKSLSLAGTGFEFGYPAGQDAGRTGRLKTIVSLEGHQGEVIRLDLEVADVGDGIFTSTGVVDNLLVGPYYQTSFPVTVKTPSEAEASLKTVVYEEAVCDAPVVPPVATEEAYVDIKPRVLNLKSNGQFVQIGLEIVKNGVTGQDFDLDSIKITHVGETEINLAPANAIKVSNNDKGMDLELKFKREEIQQAIDTLEIEEGNIKTLVPVKVTGKLKSGKPFAGTAQAKVINPGDEADLLNGKKK